MTEIVDIVRRLQEEDAAADLVRNVSIRRDAASRQGREKDAAVDPAAQNLNALIRRVADASTEEIDRIILQLQGVRDMLRDEGERVSREISKYASLNHASMTAMRVIGKSLKQWKGT